jgi:phosphoglycolate phosphatase
MESIARPRNTVTLTRVIRNIILDWSGTLVDDLPAVWKATNYVMRQARCAELTLEQFRAEFCLPFTRFYDRHVPRVPVPQLEIWFHAEFRRAQDSVCALPHARQFLEFCRSRRFRTFLLSAVHRDHFAVQCAATGLGGFFEKPYIEVHDKRKKIGDILLENQLRAQETMFVGDMEHDIETARLGGVHSCAVLTGYNTLEQLRAASPDLIVEHLGELRELFEHDEKSADPAGKLRSAILRGKTGLPLSETATKPFLT